MQQLERSIALGKALDEIVIRCQAMSWEEVECAIKQVQQYYSSACEASEGEAVEVARRCAERLMSAAARKKLPVEQQTALYEHVVSLGFTDSVQQVEVTVLHAGDCVAAGNVARGVQLLSNLNAEALFRDWKDAEPWRSRIKHLIATWQKMLLSPPEFPAADSC